MKKLILILVGIAISFYSFSKTNPFDKNKERTKAHLKKVDLPFDNFLLKTNATVPTISKLSYWDFTGNIWTPSSAIKSIYANDLLITGYELSYSLNDTQFRSTYTYNANKQLIQILGDQYSSGVFIPIYRYNITYSNNNLKQVILGEAYDLANQTWLLASRITSEFNDRGEQIRYVFEQNNNGTWNVQYGYSTKISYLNNTSKRVELIDSSYNNLTMQFEADYKELKTYNASAEVIDVSTYSNMGTGLALVSVDSIYYTAGVPTKLLQYVYDINTSTLAKSINIEQITWLNFNPNTDLFDNAPIAYLINAWQNNAWRPDERVSTTFPDANGSLVELREVYNSMNVWVNQSRYSEYFDVNKNETEYSNEVYNNQTSTWQTVYGEKFMYQYNANNNIIEEINEEFNNTVGAYQKTNKFEYSDFITIALGVSTSKNTLEVSLYPNPSADGKVSVNVNMEAASALSIKITDIKGSVVYSDRKDLGKGLSTVELKGLQQGMYVVELKSEFGMARSKLLVR